MALTYAGSKRSPTGSSPRKKAKYTVRPRLTIDDKGRVLIPKPLRDALGLARGERLELETDGESVTLRPSRETIPLSKENGVWVLRTGYPLHSSVVDDVLDRIRAERSGL